MRWFSCVLSILFFSPLVSANDLETDPQVIYGGTYKIVLLSSENAVIVQGEIMLDVHDPKNITGTWDLGLVSPEAPPKGLYPLGRGDLVGDLDDFTIRFELNPDMADRWVVFLGLAVSMLHPIGSPIMTIRGHWVSRSAGRDANGTFQARRVREPDEDGREESGAGE